MSTQTVYIVSCSHFSAAAEYTMGDTLVMVSAMSDGFCANHAKLGCSKTYRSAEAAMLGLFADHACTITAVRPAADQFNAAYVYRNGGELAELAAAADAARPTDWQDVEALKADGRHYQAGVVAAALGVGNAYGCHYGMRSTRGRAIADFQAGHFDATEALRHGCDDAAYDEADYDLQAEAAAEARLDAWASTQYRD